MIANSSNAMLELFEAVKESLPTEKLEWLANLSEFAETEAMNIQATLDALATILAGDDKSSQPSDEQLARILWGLSSQVGMVSAMVRIVSDAKHMSKSC